MNKYILILLNRCTRAAHPPRYPAPLLNQRTTDHQAVSGHMTTPPPPPGKHTNYSTTHRSYIYYLLQTNLYTVLILWKPLIYIRKYEKVLKVNSKGFCDIVVILMQFSTCRVLCFRCDYCLHLAVFFQFHRRYAYLGGSPRGWLHPHAEHVTEQGRGDRWLHDTAERRRTSGSCLQVSPLIRHMYR